MSQDSSVSEPPNSQSTKGGTSVPAPTSQWTLWSRGINSKGDWNCTHKFADGTECYHYINKDGSHYMRHRDGSGTYIPTEGTYIPRGGRDPTSKLPVLTMEEIIEEHEEVKKEHREYLAHPVKYWNGSPENRITRAWVFPTCGCGDRYSIYDDDYPGYDDEFDYENAADDYFDMICDDYEAYGRNSEDEEEDYSDDYERSPSPDEDKPTIKQEGDKTTVRTTEGPHPSASAVDETKVAVKLEIGEENCTGPIPKLKNEEKSASSVPGAAPESSVTGTEKSTARSSGAGPDIATEGKRILRSHRSKPY